MKILILLRKIHSLQKVSKSENGLNWFLRKASHSIGLTSSMLTLIFGQVGVPLIFWFTEVWQNVLITPSRVAQRFPLIIISSIATNIQHCIQNRRATNNFASGPAASMIFHRLTCSRLWLSSVNGKSTKLTNKIKLKGFNVNSTVQLWPTCSIVNNIFGWVNAFRSKLKLFNRSKFGLNESIRKELTKMCCIQQNGVCISIFF